MESSFTFLFEKISSMAVENKSDFRNIQKCRDDLLEFLDCNQWFEMPSRGKAQDIEVIFNNEAYRCLELWLKAYGKSPEEKVNLIINRFKNSYPSTVQSIRDFVYKREIFDKNCGYQLLDFIFYVISDDRELFEDERAKYVLEKAEKELSVVATKYLAEFIEDNSKSNYSWQYSINKRKNDNEVAQAYSIKDFSVMAYCVFNERYWEKERMIEKAVEDKRYADVWIFIAMHFVCGLRRTDMLKLPVPNLPESREMVKVKLLNRVADKEALKLVDEWTYRIDILIRKPTKTSGYSDIPNIKVFIPETLRLPMGIILLTVMLHHENGMPLFEVKNDFYVLKKFFGDSFMEACGNKRFVTRSANKAYLQGIGTLGDDGTTAKGYILAALARSHKGSIGSLPEITDVYLRDENFSGYKSDFILREMFERGIFGFIPVMLIRSYEEESFLSLSVSEQTEVIKCIGLNAGQIEDVVDMSKKALVHVRECTGLIFEDVLSDRKCVAKILSNLVGNRSQGKDDRYLCLRIAAGDKCIFFDRDTCLGCGYEIYTKAAFYSLVKEYQSLNQKRKSATNVESERYKQIIKTIIIPAIQEVLTSMKILYPSEDNSILLDILEGGLVK